MRFTRPTVLAVVSVIMLLASAPGCALTNLRLRRSVIGQAGTLTELQYEQVLGNLAMMSLDPDAFPTHVTLRDGSAQIQDNGTISSASPSTVYPSVIGSRTVVEQWTLIPTTDDVELRILRVAYRRALGFEEMPDQGLANDLAHDLCKQINNDDYIDLRSDPNVNTRILDGSGILKDLNKVDMNELEINSSLADRDTRSDYYAKSAEVFDRELTRLNILANAFRQMVITSNDQNLVFEDEVEPELAMDIATYVRFARGKPQVYTASPVVRDARRQVKDLYRDMGELHGGWFGVGPKGAIPDGASYVGQYRGQYAWVCPAGRKDLADFTLKILGFASLVKDPSITSIPGGPRYSPTQPGR